MGPRAKALLVVLAILSPVLIAGLLVWSLLGLLLSGSPRHLTILFMAAAGAATAALAASSGDGAAQILSWNSHAAWSAQVLDLAVVAFAAPGVILVLETLVARRARTLVLGSTCAAAVSYAVAKAVAAAPLGGWTAVLVAVAVVGPLCVTASLLRLWLSASLHKLLEAEDALMALEHAGSPVASEQPSATPTPKSSSARTPRRTTGVDDTPLAEETHLIDARSPACPRKDSLSRIVPERPEVEERGWYRRFRCAGVATLEVFHSGCNGSLPAREAPVLVLVHGYASGNALWASVLRNLATRFHVLTVDWKGCGASQRPLWTPRSPEEAESWLVSGLEQWRDAMQLDHFVLCGHSMGCIISLAYAEAHPERVDHLLLASPAAMTLPPKHRPRARKPIWRLLRWLWERDVTPMRIARWMGPLGQRFLSWAVQRRLSWMNQPDGSSPDGPRLAGEYLYHNWALRPSGEFALNALLAPGAWGRRPLSPRFSAAMPMPLTFLYGGDTDWMNSDNGRKVVARLKTEGKEDADVIILPDAGHQVVLEDPEGFVAGVFTALGRTPLREGKVLVPDGEAPSPQ